MASVTPIVAYRHGSVPDKALFPPETVFSDDEGKGKKYALQKAVAEARTERVWLLDDDVLNANSKWATIRNTDLSADLTILPLKMSEGSGRLIERLQQTEYVAIQALTLLAAERGKAVMCSGANLIVRRERWLESFQDLHTDLPSGDDMFLLESFKRRGLLIDVLALPVDIAPQPTLRSLLRQRMRWAGKAPRYRDDDTRRCGMAVVLINVLSVVCPPLWILKLSAEISLLRYACKKYPMLLVSGKMNYMETILLSIIYPWYMLICLAGGVLNTAGDNKKQSHSFL